MKLKHRKNHVTNLCVKVVLDQRIKICFWEKIFQSGKTKIHSVEARHMSGRIFAGSKIHKSLWNPRKVMRLKIVVNFV